MRPNVPTSIINSFIKHRRLSQPLLFSLVFLGLIYPYPVWGSPYQTADHFWPLQNITDGMLKDVQGDAHTIVYNGGRIKKVAQLGTSLYLDGKDDWVDTGGFNADCVTDPTRCKEGFSLAFWLKVYGSGFIMSSGSFTNSKRGPGFRLVYDTSTRGFEFVLETATKRWRIHVQGDVNKWMHMVFSWKESIGLEYYEDGNLSTYNNKHFFLATRPKTYTPVITLARPNNVMDVMKFGHFEISQLAIWMKWLSSIETSGVYLHSVVYSQDTAVCCYFKTVGLCTVNACYDPKQCKRIDETHKCLCPRVSKQLRTCQKKIEGYCVDKIESCRMYASQPKYCKHRKMRELCPRSCLYCAANSTTEKPLVDKTDDPSSRLQGISPDNPRSSGGGLFISTEILQPDTTSTWPVYITPTLNPSSSSYAPVVMPSSSMPIYGSITTRKMARGKDCETLSCFYYAQCRRHQDYAQCECMTTCSFQYEPVCGTNSKTYLNKCVLKAESCIIGRWIRVAKKGHCGSRYPNAEHYWPFNSTSTSKTLLDVRGKSKTLTYNGVVTTYAEQLGPVLSLDGIDDWIIISENRGKCINDPTLCSMGLTVAFWLRYHAGEFILSGGRYTDHQSGPGFRFICLNCESAVDSNNAQSTKRFVLDLSTQTQEWKIFLDVLPKAWFHFAFTWHLDHGLKVYKNGKLVVKDTTPRMVEFAPLSRPVDQTITVGRPNSISKLHQYGKFEIGHLVIWHYELSQYEVEVAFLTVLAKTTKSLICCHFKKADPCLVNPCSNGASCRTIDAKFPCICPDITEHPCKRPSPIYPCIDRSDDCAMYASQIGYCDYHKRYMVSLCAKSCRFCSSIVAPQKSLVPPEASPSFIDPRVLLTSGIGSRTVLLHPVASKTQSQRMQNVSPTPTPYPTTRPHYCDIGSQSCICMNCEGNTNNGFACCTDLIEQENIDEGVVLSLSSISFEEFKNKILKLQSLLRDIVTDHCTGTSCYQNVHSKRLRRNLISDQTGQETGIRNPEQYIRSWDGSPITPSNTIRPYSRKKSPIRNLLSTTVTPTLGRPVAVDVVVFKIAPNAGQNKKLSTGMYVSLTSLVDGTNQTYILKGDILSSLIRRKRDVFKRKLNITIDSVIKWSTWRDMQSIGPRMAESATQSGSTTAFGPSVIPGEGTPNMEGREGRNSTANMSRKTFIIVLVTGIGGFVVLAIIIIYMLVKFLRRMKGEFVPDKIYPNEQKSNSGSEQLIPSFVDPSTPRITDVPKKTVRSGSSGTGGGQGSGGTKKQKKPMGVKVTYKPPKWD